MESVLLVIHLFACVAMVATVMLQRSEGGALGMGGGGTGGFISGRGAANALMRATMILAGVFVVTSLVLTRMGAERAHRPGDIERAVEQIQKQRSALPPKTPTGAPAGPAGTAAPAGASAPAASPLAPSGAAAAPAAGTPAAPASGASALAPQTGAAPANAAPPASPQPQPATPAKPQ